MAKESQRRVPSKLKAAPPMRISDFPSPSRSTSTGEGLLRPLGGRGLVHLSVPSLLKAYRLATKLSSRISGRPSSSRSPTVGVELGLTPPGAGTSKITWPVSPRRATSRLPPAVFVLLTITAGTSRALICPSSFVSMSGETVGAASKIGSDAFHCHLTSGSQLLVGWKRLDRPLLPALFVSFVSGTVLLGST